MTAEEFWRAFAGRVMDDGGTDREKLCGYCSDISLMPKEQDKRNSPPPTHDNAP